MNKNGYIYITVEVNSDGTEITHNGLKKLGIGKTNNLDRRLREHNGGSKNTNTVEFIKTYDCDELNITDTELERFIHNRLSYLGFTKIKNEVFTGRSLKTIINKDDEKTIVNKGEELSIDLITRLASNHTNVDLFKIDLNLLPHQNEAIDFINKVFKDGKNSILLAFKPRSGKSFITYQYMINEKPKNVILFTNYPVLNHQWKDEFERFRGHDYNIIISREVKGEICLDKTRPNLVMISLQDAKGGDNSDEVISEGLKKQKFNKLTNIDWDLVIFDEIHKGKETKKTDKLLNGLKYKKLIGLSATPTKNLLRGTFTKENTLTYGIVDEKRYKKDYPDKYKNPDIEYHLFDIDESVRNTMDYFTHEEGFNFSKFLRVNDGHLVYNNDITTLFSWLFRMDRFNRVNKHHEIINKCNSILLFVENNECQELIKDKLNDLVGGNYDVYFTNSDVTDTNRLLKAINEDYTPKDGKKTIVIANKQLTTGITLKYCDLVIFMNDWKSMDDYIQASYRCQSPNEGKETCYVIDLNPGRAFNIIGNYVQTTNNLKGDKTQEEVFREYLNCVPIFHHTEGTVKKFDFESFINEFHNTLDTRGDIFPKSMLKDITSIELEGDMILELGDLESDLTHKNVTTEKLDDNGVEMGKTSKSGGNGGDTEKIKPVISEEEKTMVNQILKNVDFLRERTYILSLSTKFKYNNIGEIFGLLDHKRKLRGRFLDNLMIESLLNKKEEKTGLNCTKKGISPIFIDREKIYKIIKNIYKSDNIFNQDVLNERIMFFNSKVKEIFTMFKNVEERMRNIEEIFDLISKYLGVSEVEKKQNGEVFTPFSLINEMLDQLPVEVWSNPNLKWLDPANGIGNFPAVIIQRLMIGLEGFEPDPELRYKHILEKMIYVCDISPKNMFLYVNIFDPEHKYKMNYHRGSFLEEGFDTYMENKWNINGFDIIIGNPPYHELDVNGSIKGGGKGGTNNLWSKFFIKSKEVSNQILFIHPPSFLTPNHTVLNKMYEDGGLKFLKIFEKSPFDGVGTQACYYRWVKGYDDLCQLGDVMIDLTDGVLPNSSNVLDFSIFNKFFNGETLSFERNCKIHTQNKKEYITDNITDVNRNKLYVGSKIKYTSLNIDEKNREKVVISRSGYLNPILDYDSCVSESNYYYLINNVDEGNNLVNLLKSKLYDYCLKKSKFSGFFHGEVLKNIPKLQLDREWTDQQLYEYFELTEDEIKLIEGTIK